MALSRVSTTTGRCLSGRENRYKRTSPRAIAPAMTLLVPRPELRLRLPDGPYSRAGRGPQPRAGGGASDALEAPREPTRNGSLAPASPLHSQPEAIPNPAPLGWFPYCGGYSTAKSTVKWRAGAVSPRDLSSASSGADTHSLRSG